MRIVQLFKVYLPPLKKLVAISFLFIFLCANTEIGQLLKLPVLLHHYLEHHEEDSSISFADFLHKHYNEKNAHSSTNNEHGKLPFKSHDIGMANNSIAYYVPVAFSFKVEVPSSTKVNICIYDVAFNSSSHLAKIWQPPKSC